MGLTKVHRVKTWCRYWPGRYGTRRICEFQNDFRLCVNIFFLQPAHQHFNCNISRNDGKKKRLLDKWQGHLRGDTVSKYRVENGTVPGSTCEGHKYSPSTDRRKKLAGASSEEKSALLHKESKMCRRWTAAAFQLDLGLRKDNDNKRL